jgi:acyl carrier protein
MVINALAVATKREPASIALTHAFRDDLGLNSLDTIELMYGVEEAFDLMIPDTDLPKLVTVGALVQYLHERVSPGGSSLPASIPSPAKPATKPVGAVRPTAPHAHTKKRSRA